MARRHSLCLSFELCAESAQGKRRGGRVGREGARAGQAFTRVVDGVFFPRGTWLRGRVRVNYERMSAAREQFVVVV